MQQGRSPPGPKLMPIPGRCCMTGTASSVSARSPFGFPLVKFTPLPSLEVAPMKTDALLKKGKPGERRMGRINFSPVDWKKQNMQRG